MCVLCVSVDPPRKELTSPSCSGWLCPKVRASNLQDLVYKNGQGGITKATVSITFDNSNKGESPLGFETHDEITVTRQVV